MEQNIFKILFVCTGNICRSPTADGVLRHMVRQTGLEDWILVDSAGTHGYHIGEPPDSRAVVTAMTRGGVDLAALHARQVCAEDFSDFDWIIAMDGGHHDILMRSCNGSGKNILRFCAFLGDPEGHVSDPYYGGLDSFAQVYDQIEAGCRNILAAAMTEIGERGAKTY